jgi:hypothetical protein
MSQPPSALDPRPPQPNVTAPRRRVCLEPRAVITGVLFVAINGSAIWYLARPEPLLYHLRTLAIRTYSLGKTGGLRPGCGL